MRFKLHAMPAIACIGLLALNLPAYGRPLSNSTDARRPPPAEPVSLSARMKPPFGMPALVAEARKYMGTNPTDRKRLWCATFMNFVLAKLGYAGTNSDAAKSFAYYGRRISEPRVGAIAVLTRGKRGGHVGVVSGIDKSGNPVIISGNHNKRVGEAVYARARVIAYVMPTEQRAVATQVAERGPASRPNSESGLESPITELLAAIEAEQARAERPAPAPQPVQRAAQPVQTPPVPHRVVQQTAEPVTARPSQAARGGVGNPFAELIGTIERAQAAPQRGRVAAAENGRRER
jgi:uncharacterized protein (TIGR02594 family)